MKQLTYILLLSLLFFTCIKKDLFNPADELPGETQTGANTFGCVVNGRIWVPRTPFPLHRLYSDYYRETLAIHATLKHDGRHQRIDIYIDSLVAPGRFILNKTAVVGSGTSTRPSVSFESYNNTSCRYETDNAVLISSAEVEMTRVDTTNRIFSGRFTFKFTALGGDCGEVVVTNGRFDVPGY